MNSKLIISIVLFVLLISMIPAIIGLNSGFMVAEFVVFIILALFGVFVLTRLFSGKNAWCGMFVFFLLNIINIFAIYARMLDLAMVSIPILFGLILYILPP